jgi:branched-subunit amino acid ABC-type transport system permease component
LHKQLYIRYGWCPGDASTQGGFGITISVDRFVLVGVAAVLSAVLWACYRYTHFGLATSAVAENQRAASAIGLSPDWIAAANWALGSALTGVAAILIAPSGRGPVSARAVSSRC